MLRDTDLIHHFPFLMTFSDLEIHVTLRVLFIMSDLVMIIFMLDLVSHLAYLSALSPRWVGTQVMRLLVGV